MSIDSVVFTELMKILASRQPIAAAALLTAMEASGHRPAASRQAVQLAFERGRIRLDEQMRVAIVEREPMKAGADV